MKKSHLDFAGPLLAALFAVPALAFDLNPDRVRSMLQLPGMALPAPVIH